MSRSIIDPDFDLDAAVREGHAAKYPAGCGMPGHHCSDCHRRLGGPVHKVNVYRVGRRPGYLGRVRVTCTECSYESGD